MKTRRVYPALFVALSAFALYLPALRNGFAYDDVAIIQQDERVHTLSNAHTFFTQGYWEDSELALYRPLATLSFAVDWSISGGRPTWFMFTNALWNAAACALLFLLLARFATVGAAFGGAMLFAVHPVHVEAVANVVGRAELMAATFMLGGLLLWPAMLEPKSRRVPAVGALFALALLTKESAIMLPALLVLLDAARRELTPRTVSDWAHRRAAPLLLMTGIAVGYLIIRALVLNGLAPARLDAALEVTSGVDRLLTALQTWPVYLRLLLFPVVLLADYGPRILMPAVGVTPEAVAGGLILCLLVFGGILAWWRGRALESLALLWLPATLLPVSNLIIPIGIIVAERTLYLPSAAVAFAVVLAARRLPRAAPMRIAAAGLAVVIALFSVRTVIRIPDWRSTDVIFAALLRDRPDSFRAHWHQARLAAASGRHDLALERYVQAVELWPYRPRLMIETTRAAVRAGNLPYAQGIARFAFQRWPTNVDAARLLAATTLDLGDTIAARRIVSDALYHIPGDSMLLRMQDATSDEIPR